MSLSAPKHAPIAPTGRVGSFEVLRELSRAPGATFVEARDASGQTRLLQLTRCRAATSEAERAERHLHEKAIAKATFELLGDAELTVHAHGGVDVEGGARVLFWALPWVETPFLWPRVQERPIEAADLLRVALSLAERLGARHAWGRVDPLLSELAVRQRDSGRAEVVGVPIAVDRAWLSEDMVPRRFAPEERATGTLTSSGDVWRLGQCLLALAEHASDLPDAVLGTFLALSDDEPARRPSGIPAIIETFERALVALSIPTSLAAASGEAPLAVVADLGLAPVVPLPSSVARAPTGSAPDTAPVEKAPEELPDPLELSSWDIPAVSIGDRLAVGPAVGVREAFPAESESDATSGPNSVSESGSRADSSASSGADSTAASNANSGRDDDTDALELVALVSAPAEDRPREPTPRSDTDPSPVRSFDTPDGGVRAPLDRASTEVDGRPEPIPSRGVIAGELDDDSLPMIPEEMVEPVEPEAITHPSAAEQIDRIAPEPSAPEAPAVFSLGETSAVTALLAPEAADETGAVLEPPRPEMLAERPERSPPTEALDLSPFASELPNFFGVREPEPMSDPGRVSEPTNGRHHGVPLEAMAAAWQQPVLPPGESPWSEIVHPRGTHHRDRSEFPGFPDEVPIPPPRSEKRSTTFEVEVPPHFEDAPKYVASPEEVEAEVAATMRGLDKRKFVSAVLVALVIFGFFALISRVGGDPVESKDPVIITSADEVLLDSDPPGATVVAERDGAVLGKTPMQILVAPGFEAAVFLLAPDREPLRLSLPTRGGVTARLSPLDGVPCSVRLLVPPGIEIEGVDFELGGGEERSIPGAAVVRAKGGQELRGARLVLCPSLGGPSERALDFERVPRHVSVRVSQPEGSAAYLNGEPIGTVPGVGRTHAAFSRVRIDDQTGETEERWVSTEADAELWLAPPKPKLLPHVVAPDGERELEVPERPEPPTEEAGASTAAGTRAEATVDEAPAKPVEARPAVKASNRALARSRKLLKIATKFMNERRLDRAREALSECIEADPGAAECHRALGEVYWRARSTHKAREHYTRYLELVPQAPDADRVRKRIAQ